MHNDAYIIYISVYTAQRGFRMQFQLLGANSAVVIAPKVPEIRVWDALPRRKHPFPQKPCNFPKCNFPRLFPSKLLPILLHSSPQEVNKFYSNRIHLRPIVVGSCTPLTGFQCALFCRGGHRVYTISRMRRNLSGHTNRISSSATYRRFYEPTTHADSNGHLNQGS